MATEKKQSHLDPSYGGLLQRQATTFYRFDLPKPSVAFDSDEGVEIFAEALGEGYMRGYFKLASQFRTQPETTFCGLASIIMVPFFCLITFCANKERINLVVCVLNCIQSGLFVFIFFC